MAELDLAIARIEEAPRQWPPYLGDTRRYLLRRFRFFVVFREMEDGVQVLAVAHDAGPDIGRVGSRRQAQSNEPLQRIGSAGR